MGFGLTIGNFKRSSVVPGKKSNKNKYSFYISYIFILISVLEVLLLIVIKILVLIYQAKLRQWLWTEPLWLLTCKRIKMEKIYCKYIIDIMII